MTLKEQAAKVMQYLKTIITPKFWGKITISFEGGKIVNIKKTENFKVK
jgi:hypothetical protein